MNMVPDPEHRGHTADFKVPELPVVVTLTNVDGKALRHAGYAVWADHYNGHGDFKWWMRGSLSGEPHTVSFESHNYGGHYLARDA